MPLNCLAYKKITNGILTEVINYRSNLIILLHFRCAYYALSGGCVCYFRFKLDLCCVCDVSWEAG